MQIEALPKRITRVGNKPDPSKELTQAEALIALAHAISSMGITSQELLSMLTYLQMSANSPPFNPERHVGDLWPSPSEHGYLDRIMRDYVNRTNEFTAQPTTDFSGADIIPTTGFITTTDIINSRSAESPLYLVGGHSPVLDPTNFLSSMMGGTSSQVVTPEPESVDDGAWDDGAWDEFAPG